MANLRYTFRSVTLAMDVSVTIMMPANASFKHQLPYEPGMRFQTLYLLHGRGEDDSSWLRRTRIEEYAEENRLMVVCPATCKGMFMNTAYGVRYEDYLTQELPRIVQSFFPGALTREDTFIAGQGLGAGGALRLALKHPELYSYCAALTPGIGAEMDPEVLRNQIETIPMFKNVYNDDPAFLEENDLLAAARKQKESGTVMPPIYLTISDHEMPAIQETIRYQKNALESLGYDVTFEVLPGSGHDHEYCDRGIRKVIEEKLPLKKSYIYPQEKKQ